MYKELFPCNPSNTIDYCLHGEMLIIISFKNIKRETF